MFQSRTLIITIVTATTTIISGGTARSPPRYGQAAQTSGSAREFEPFHQIDEKYLAPIKNESTMHNALKAKLVTLGQLLWYP